MWQYYLLDNSFTIVHFKCIDSEYIWVVKIRNTSEAVSGDNTPPGHHTDCGPKVLRLYVSIGQYCASSVFLIVIFLGTGECELFIY